MILENVCKIRMRSPQGLKPLHYVCKLVALSRAWFTARPGIADFTGPNPMEKVLEEFEPPIQNDLTAIFSFLSVRGQAILQFVLVELEVIKARIVQEASIHVETDD